MNDDFVQTTVKFQLSGDQLSTNFTRTQTKSLQLIKEKKHFVQLKLIP